MNDILDEIAADVNKPKPLSNSIGAVAVVANKLLQRQEELAMVEQHAKDLKAEVFKIQTEELPGIMSEVGVREFTLETGQKIEVKPFYNASITEEDPERKQKALAWLEANGHGDIIKNLIVLSFGKGTEEQQAKAKALLKQHGLSYDENRSVHFMTLRSWLKEQVEKGAELDLEVLGAFIGQKAEIKKAKESKNGQKFI